MRRADRLAIRSASHRFTRPLSVLLARPPERWCPPLLAPNPVQLQATSDCALSIRAVFLLRRSLQ